MSGDEDQFDEFGIKKIYRSSTRPDAPDPFVMGIGNWKNRIDQWDGDDGSFSGSGRDVIYESKNSEKQRMNVFSESNQIEVPKEILDRNVLINRKDSDGVQRGGWMDKPSDWRSYEITAIQFIPTKPKGFENKPEPEDTCAWYGRGAKHTGSSIKEGSQGSAVKPDLRYKGNKGGWHILKETIHFKQDKNHDYKGTNNMTTRGREVGQNKNILESNNFGNLKNKWFGYKTIVYNEEKKVANGNAYWPVFIETYICECDSNGNPDNIWKLGIRARDDFQDFPPWSELPADQLGPKPHTISWGGPIITCRTDRESGTGGGYPGMKFKKISIREIEPGVKF